MLRMLSVAALMLTACATTDPFDDVLRAQQRLDERGIGFGVTRVPGHDAFVFQLRFATSDAGESAITDPTAAAQAAAPEGCTVVSVTPQPDGASYRVDYACVGAR
jgi:hypothetical protein